MTLLTESEFKTCLKLFIGVSNDVNDTWELVSFEEPIKRKEIKQYLVKRNVSRILDYSQDSTVQDNALQCEGLEEETESDKDEVMKTELRTDCTACTFEYHVVYSDSYAVPVLYFNACKADGQLLSLDEVWQLVPEHYKSRLQHERWTFITQQEHPILGRPFFTLHPCHTADLMKLVLASNKPTRSYLVSWLSSVGPVVGLDLPLAYAKLCDD